LHGCCRGARENRAEALSLCSTQASPLGASPIANAGHDTRAIQAWMGHKNIQHTVRYTELAPDRFKDFWRD
jgi:integrase